MEKICLVEAGSYLLGIDAAAITRKWSADNFVAEESGREESMIALAPFLDQHDRPLSESKFSVMEVKTNTGVLTLVVDRILEEIGAPDRFEPLPMLYPELARRCCPQMMIHNEQPLLLLDGGELDAVRARLKSDCGMISLDTFGERCRREATVEDTPVLHSSVEIESEQPTVELDDITFTTIVSWTMGEYLARGGDINRAISSDDLPSEYIHSLQLQGVSDDLLQSIIDKTVQQCENFHDLAVQRLRKRVMQ